MKKVIFCSFIPFVLWAQVATQPAPAPPAPPPPPDAPGPNVFFYRSIGPAIPAGKIGHNAKPVTNAPYQAQIETQTVQHLSDGNVIQNTHTSKVARDGKGRTWTEETVDRIGPWTSGNGPHTIIFISDPVSGNSYVLHPDSKTAEKMSMKGFPGGPERGHRAMIVQRQTVAGAPGGVTTTIVGDGPPPMEKMGPDEPGDVQKEDLGTQEVNGVTAQGTRVTRTIPANTIGNQLPIVSVSETWYSPELQTVVQSKHEDPRFGDTTFSVKNIQKGEPPADLFQLPSDYTVTEGPKIALPLKP
jgi:hypothetical protein